MLTTGLKWAPDTLPMNMIIAMTMRPGATTAATRPIELSKAAPIIPPPAATSTRKKVPTSSETSRRHSWRGSWKSMTRVVTSCSISLTMPCSTAFSCSSISSRPSWLRRRHEMRTGVPETATWEPAGTTDPSIPVTEVVPGGDGIDAAEPSSV